ncbi:MAG: hypothetical protein DM484_04715 [Candidatus Methylumidiphilus alinenensis]|uniref:O-antigen polymerase n=1 Tax=Candidatus Methylumidiphilus alinenensis TaxID=2202197 RepID=A0A2W4RHL5_9GAMM|nr:MAG: hypothetical protein DM484_04715 [Candidatus Methylumidiphilus alinenensis]
MNSIIDADTSDRNRSLVFTLASLLLAILFGLVAVTGNLLVFSLAVALLLGMFFVTQPAMILWAILLMGLLAIGPAPLIEKSLDPRAAYPVQILAFYLMLVSIFKAATTPSIRKDTPAFIWALICFFVFAVLNSAAHWHTPMEFFGSIKRYFQMWGIIFALCWLGFDERQIHQWQSFFIIVALVQLPFALYEVVVWVPIREAMRGSFPGIVPIDVVGGTFGSTMYGGGASGEMSTFLIIVMAFLIARKMHKTLSTGRLILLTPGVLAPLFVGETKAVIVMLPLMFLVLYRREFLAKPHFAVMALIVGGLLTLGMGYAYLSVMQTTLDQMLTETVKYNLQEKGYGENYLNRTTVLTFWAEHQGFHDPISLVFGNGLGSAHEATEGHIEAHYPHYGIGMTAASTLLWDLGLFGCSLLATIFALAWHTAAHLYRESVEPLVKADANAIQAALSLFAFHLFYRLDLLETTSFQIVFACVLGYLAWLYRRHAASMARGVP